MHRCPECNERCDCAPVGTSRKQLPAELACIHPFLEECDANLADGDIYDERFNAVR